ncbi:MAG: hypothetical protein RIB45_17710 [Marivibrio sp.]|uniref:hypothetical protein n=1 Tax=Marivibrio sp. TaxID=2039719 RepID=UPI0032EEEE46
MTNPEDDRRLAQRLRALCRSIGEQVRAGELTEERLSYQLRGVIGVADALDLRAENAGADAAAETSADNVVDLHTRRALETVAPGCDPAKLRFSGLRAPRDPRTLTRPPTLDRDPNGSGGAA